MQLEHILSGEISPEEIDTSKFMLTATTAAALRNVKLKSTIELLALDASKLSSDEFQMQYRLKQYESQFIEYLLNLSEANVAEAERKTSNNTTEE